MWFIFNLKNNINNTDACHGGTMSGMVLSRYIYINYKRTYLGYTFRTRWTLAPNLQILDSRKLSHASGYDPARLGLTDAG
jgi:hypothetical protein